MTATTGKAARRKGVDFEYRVRKEFEDAGWTVRGLEGSGDQLCFDGNGVTVHSEAKNQERLKVPEWWRQTTTEAPPGAVPVLTIKLAGGEMVSLLRTADLLRLTA